MSEGPQDRDAILTQASAANLTEDSHPSLIYRHGASMAKKAVRSKPQFAEFMCDHNEVGKPHNRPLYPTNASSRSFDTW
jgi:hypothetical protein